MKVQTNILNIKHNAAILGSPPNDVHIIGRHFVIGYIVEKVSFVIGQKARK